MEKSSDCTDGLHLNLEDQLSEEENLNEAETGHVSHIPDNMTKVSKEVEKEHKKNPRRTRDAELIPFILQAILLVCKMLIICATVVVALYNLSLPTQSHSTLWTSLLSSCLGYALAAGKLKRKGNHKKVKQSKRLVLDVENDQSRSV